MAAAQLGAEQLGVIAFVGALGVPFASGGGDLKPVTVAEVER